VIASPLRFVVLSMPRVGSNMLVEQLGTHREIRCFPAVFSKNEWPPLLDPGHPLLSWIEANIPRSWNDQEARLERPEDFVGELFEKCSDRSAVGFKHHLGLPDIATNFVLGSGFKKILLKRSNLLAAWSSQKIVEATGQGFARTGDLLRQAKVCFNVDEFELWCRRRLRRYEKAREPHCAGPIFEIEYAKARTPEGIRELGVFLGIDPAGFAPPPTLKRNPEDIVSRFSNRDDVRAYLDASDLQSWALES
jgi:hypothetical protein